MSIVSRETSQPEPTEARRDPDRLLNVKEAADLLGVNLWTIYKWAESGRIPSRKLGSRVRFSRSDLLECGEVWR